MTIYRTLMALGVLVALQAFAQPQRRDNPTAKDTLRWMQTSLASGSGDYWVGHETRSVRLEDFAGCKVHFSASTHQQPFANGEPAPDKKPTRIDYFFELGDIDPANITFSKGPDSGTDVPSFITIRTQNDEKKITSGYSWEPEVGAQPDYTFVIFAVEAFGSDNDYVVRFAAAFKHAVEACGGKPSLFANSDSRDERAQTAPGGVAVQSAPHRKDIATIAKEANGAVVSIVMSDKEGHPIAQGSGFLISKDGWVVTNYHVIKSGSSAVVKLPDGAFFPVDGIVASDKGRDVAIIKAHGNDFRTLTLGDSARLQVGAEVVAIGNPLLLESTVSNGIISAIRTVEEEGGKFLQTTAPISHGSSGGPLFTMTGEVVGITSAVITGGENLNFAIPIDDVKPIIGSSVSKVRSGAGVGSALPDEPESDEAEPATATQTTGPSLSETDEWLNNTFQDGVQGGYLNCVDAEGERIDTRLLGTSRWPLRTWCDHTYFGLGMKGCNATLITKHEGSFELRVVLDFNLKDIDPSSLRVNKSTMEPTAEIWQVMTLDTRNHEKLVTKHYGDREPYLSHWDFETGVEGIYMRPEYAPRFIKAFQHAIELCGGKSSAF
jgi:S1-C subfamily serine protease